MRNHPDQPENLSTPSEQHSTTKENPQVAEKWHVAHSGYANSPFVIYEGDRAPNFSSKFPLSGIHAIAEVFHDEGPDHEAQRRHAYLVVAAPRLLAYIQDLCDRRAAEQAKRGATGDDCPCYMCSKVREGRLLIRDAQGRGFQ